MRGVGVGLGAAVLLLTAGIAFAAGTGEVQNIDAKRTVVFTEGFEGDTGHVKMAQYTSTDQSAHSGKRCLLVDAQAGGTEAYVDLPFEATQNHLTELSFWAKSDAGLGCLVFMRKDGLGAYPVHSENSLPSEWTRVRVLCKPVLPGTLHFRIQSPTPRDKRAGKVYIDDMAVTLLEAPGFTRSDVEDFPALATDKAGAIWAATLGDPLTKREVRVYRAGDSQNVPAFVLAPEDATAVANPVVAGLDKGCFVAVAVEKNSRWRIAYAFVDGKGKADHGIRYIETEGTANILPAAAYVDGRVCLLWEANPAGQRGIYASWITPKKATEPQRISARGVVGSNPAVVALANNSVFAAWDSVREKEQDLYGAWWRDGKWQPDQRLTRDARMENHVALAANRNQVWMAWQATTFNDSRLQSRREQRIVVAALTDQGLIAPPSQFDKLSAEHLQLVQPRIGFDPEGRLWVTARKSFGQLFGWQPIAWCYSGDTWTGPHDLWADEGRWRPADIAWGKVGGVAAVQRDTCVEVLTGTPRKSEVLLVKVSPEWSPAPAPLKTTALAMPETEFCLAKQRFETSVPDFPRDTQRHQGQALNLYYGSMHEHTEISLCGRSLAPTIHDLYTTQRDVDGLDFTAVTDHGEHMDNYDWLYTQIETTANNDPGRFVTFLAQEWTSGLVEYDPPREYKRYGHHNLVFLDPHFPKYFNAHKSEDSPRDVWNALTGADFIMIPHQLADCASGANMPTDWSFTDERLQPLAEIYQARESYEYEGCPRQAKIIVKGHCLQDAWAQGIIIGVIASSDHGGGKGKAGIWAKDLTRESLFEAFRARHTFGMSDTKMSLFVTSGDHMMGDIVTRTTNGPIPFHIKATTPRPIKEVVIWRNNEIVHRSEPNKTEIDMDWVDDKPLDTDHAWYYVRLHCTDNELAWSSPIWYKKG